MRSTASALSLGLTIFCWQTVSFGQQERPQETVPIETPQAFERPQLGIQLIESSAFIRANDARATFQVDGAGLTAAILDTGLRVTHVDFLGRVATQKNFTPDNGADPNNAADGNGHGTNVCGIVAANRLHVGIAPGARVAPVKVLSNSGTGQFTWIEQGLDWVIANCQTHHISVVNMSLGDPGNYTDDNFGSDPIQNKIRTLRQNRIAVVVSAGNGFFNHQSHEGMSYPGIFRETVSTGAVYDADEGPFSYQSGAIAFSTGPGRITPFSQRLHESTASATRTDIFSPGAPVTSSGHLSDVGESIQHGTSQAAPITGGVILLVQQYYQRQTGRLPTIDQLETWLRRGGVPIVDGDDEDDNVENTSKTFIRIDAYGTLDAVRRELRRELLMRGTEAALAK